MIRLKYAYTQIAYRAEAAQHGQEIGAAHERQSRFRSRIGTFLGVNAVEVVMQFECGTRILRVIHGRDARATSPNCTATAIPELIDRSLTRRYIDARTGIEFGVDQMPGALRNVRLLTTRIVPFPFLLCLSNSTDCLT